MDRQTVHTPHIIIDQTHLHAFFYFLFQDLQDRVPHDSLLNDEIFQINVMFCLLQIFQHRCEHLFTDGEIFHRGMFPHRITAKGSQIIHRACHIRILCSDFCKNLLILLHGIFHAIFDHCHFLGNLFAWLLVSDQHIQDTTQQRDQHDQDNPCDLIGRIFILTDQI